MKFKTTSILFIMGIACPALALEPWADPNLPIKNGLELWLDASRENTFRAEEFPLIPSGESIDVWHDASGHERDLVQPVPSARPRLLQTTQGHFVSFDGVDDFLFVHGLNQSFDKTTIFIQAAPRSNKGNLRALFASNRSGVNDYSSGINIDLGGAPQKQFDCINIEGRGFVTILDMMHVSFPFGETHTLAVASEVGDKGIQLWVDGMAQGTRGRAKESRVRKRNNQVRLDEALGFDQIIVGGRFYSNAAEPPHVQGFFDGQIAEVLVYSRILSDDERLQVERYLRAKASAREMTGRKIVSLTAVTNPPPVQMLVPGFTARELPVQLNNINCVKYRPDGKLVALGYDGNIWLLSDTNDDGLEDKATPFWNKASLRAPIGMALTPPGYSRGEGVFVPAKGKLSLIVDTNKDDIADEEIIVAKGWNELFHGVDALGVAVDKDESIYFGLGTANFTDGYLMDKATGKATYSLTNERGTILRVAPDFSSREIMCTGIRFPVAMAFNAAGDLFCSDQEGATWLPNGNPLDELLYIERGKHYGFPPRHAKHLPSVLDEPSVFDYGPQHQSTCGLNFNEPVNGGPVFGPSWWKGDAFVAGYSRGKLWRTKLVKTGVGYVGQNQLIGCVNMLPADVCVSPRGEMVIAAHSGQPDWGSGPNGAGKLYKISYNGNLPQPVSIWPASSTETYIQFDRPLDPAQLKDLAKKITVTEGRYVSAGDQFESLRPGYQVVRNQLGDPRYELEIHSAALDADGQTLAIRTHARTRGVNYAVTLPRLDQGNASVPGALAQHSVIELAYDLTGVEATWQGVPSKEKKTGWLPHLDLAVARAFTAPSSEHAKLWSAFSAPGKVTLRAQLDLWQMLRSATQPGSKLDFEYPDESVTVVLKSKAPLQVAAPSMKIERVSDHETRLIATPKANVWFPIEVALQTSAAEPTLEVSWFTAEDSRVRALPLRRIFLPWAKPAEASSKEETERTVPEIAGGNWLNGKKIFFGDQASCYKCHAVQSQGGKIGPDLSNLIHRDYASVMKDIVEPNAAINPDHVSYNIELKNGEVLSGVPVGGGDAEVLLADASGRANPVRKSDIASMKASALSLMPEGLLQALTERQIKDLLTYLLMPPPLEPARLEIPGEPPPRKRAEVERFLKSSSAEAKKSKPLRVVLCSGPKDHGPGEHDYPLWQKRWSKLLALADDVTVETASGWPSAGQFSKADVIVFYSNNPGWSAGRAPELDAFLNRGGGAVYIHYAVDGHAHCDELAQRIGLAWRGGQSAFRHGPLDLKFQPHPIGDGFGPTHFIDESYWNLVGSETNIQLLASGVEGDRDRPLLWTREQGRGRVFVSIPGHYTWTFDDPLFRILILRGIAWTAHQPLDRLAELATVGARLAD